MKRSLVLATAIASLLASFGAAAHKQWLLPSATVVAGNEPFVTVDAAVSNQLYYPDHVPMRLDNVTITAPDGSVLKPQNGSTGKYRSVFDVALAQQGTYRIANVNAGLSARWDTAESLAAAAAATQGQGPGGPGPRGGFLRNATPEDLATKVPKDAKNLQVTEGVSRVETFVSNGSPSEVKLTGKGLELLPVTHPNDLFAGEEAKFKLMVDGKPAAGLEVEIVRGATRYRNAQEEISVKTGADGSFAVTWPEAGMYWLEASIEDAKTSVPQAKRRRLGYVATLEVLPQ
ncbi:DUF4198 domain-containing protein [Pseudoxanthomonas koreensis]|uniref:DUF4198 domain-containing protein n=1 Tax=Pseudoxanthomonas koreensis TaxID=266061 RepID=UPI001391528F|nr:DUF4198 domain-containing protein [Pseudoxanthomonas koreensis]KAF1691163.1 ABC transporter permease [Pseudoxanthomonas koreensis]